MAEEVGIFESLAFDVVFAEFAPVVEEDADDAALYLYVFRVGLDRIEAFKEMEHLVGVVEQATGEGVVDAGGCRIFAV